MEQGLIGESFWKGEWASGDEKQGTTYFNILRVSLYLQVGKSSWRSQGGKTLKQIEK